MSAICFHLTHKELVQRCFIPFIAKRSEIHSRQNSELLVLVTKKGSLSKISLIHKNDFSFKFSHLYNLLVILPGISGPE
jgi:hypothetical protein